jgi:hypothetical protein
LYDLENDIAEMNDIAADHPETAAKIGQYLTMARIPSADWEPRWSAEKTR